MKVKIELFGAARDFSKQNLLELNLEQESTIKEIRIKIIQYLDKTDYEQTSRIFKIKSFKKINWNDLLQNNRALATKEKLKSMRN